MHCKTDAVNSLEFEVRSVFEGMHTSLTTVKRMYRAASDKLEAIEAKRSQTHSQHQQRVSRMRPRLNSA